MVLPLCSGKWLVGAKPVSGTRVEVNAQVWVAAGEKYHLIAIAMFTFCFQNQKNYLWRMKKKMPSTQHSTKETRKASSAKPPK